VTEREQLLEELRPVSYGIAYWVLGSVPRAVFMLNHAIPANGLPL
jgi:hypothetical protein